MVFVVKSVTSEKIEIDVRANVGDADAASNAMFRDGSELSLSVQYARNTIGKVDAADGLELGCFHRVLRIHVTHSQSSPGCHGILTSKLKRPLVLIDGLERIGVAVLLEDNIRGEQQASIRQSTIRNSEYRVCWMIEGHRTKTAFPETA